MKFRTVTNAGHVTHWLLRSGKVKSASASGELTG